MSSLHSGMSLLQLQDYVKSATTERGFNEETIAEKFMLLQEEMGEAAKAVRKNTGLKVHEDSKTRNLQDEFADMLFLIFDISNQLGVNLDQSFMAKEEVNAQRTWD